MHTLSDGKVKVELLEPSVGSKSVGAVANVKINVSDLSLEELAPYSSVKILTGVVHAVAFKNLGGKGNCLIFSNIAPPAYEAYIRKTSLFGEIMERVTVFEQEGVEA